MRFSFGCALSGWVLIAALAACAAPQKSDPETIYKTASVAVAVGCVKNRPIEPPSLNERITPPEKWRAMPPGAKAQAALAQVGERLNYEQALAAATSGCKEAPAP